MTPSRPAPGRPGQKTFSLGTAREPFESWCRRNGYEERTVVLAGWLAVQRMTHDQRIELFADLERAAGRGYDLDRPAAETSARGRAAGRESRRPD